MQFTTPAFFAFLLFFFVFWKFVSKRVQLRLVFLVIASLVFYSWADWRYIFLIAVIGAIGFCGGEIVAKDGAGRKKALIVSIIACLFFLLFFRYSLYFLGILLKILVRIDKDIFLVRFLEDITPLFIEIKQKSPLGISFFTLQTIGYLADVYLHRIPPARNIMHFLSFTFLFPKLFAGPIERGKDLLPQLVKENIQTSAQDRWDGTKLIIAGYFMKVVIADNLAPYVNYAFDAPTVEGGTVYWWLIVTAFALQLYMDFSGYSIIARGLGKWMGFDLVVNFNHPYMAVSLGDFWSRWHISLSSWLRDYIFFPLSRSRFGKGKQHLNNLITMIVSGIWHGAGINFIFWGVLHAAYTSLERVTKWPARLSASWPGRVLSWALVTFQVWVGWVFFRAATVQRGLEILKKMFTVSDPFVVSKNQALLLVLGIGLLTEIFSLIGFKRLDSKFGIVSRVFELVLFAVMLAMALFFRGEGNQFIYFQF